MDYNREYTRRIQSLRWRRQIGGGDNDVQPRPPLSLFDQWRAEQAENQRQDMPVLRMRGYLGVVGYNAFRYSQQTRAREIPPVDPRDDHRSLPRLDYSLAFIDRRGKQKFIQPTLQYDPDECSYFKLDWNQTPCTGEAADYLNWPNMFEERNRMESKCRSYHQKVPKARSVEMMAGRRGTIHHNDVCQRLQVEINAMSRRIMRGGMIATAITDAERDGYDASEVIREIKMDPQYATDPELSDYSDDD